jgi:hypothetical protein
MLFLLTRIKSTVETCCPREFFCHIYVTWQLKSDRGLSIFILFNLSHKENTFIILLSVYHLFSKILRVEQKNNKLNKDCVA